MRRVLRDPMKNVVWREWVEPVDHQAYAVVATAEETHRGGIYAAGTFLLAPAGTRRWQAIDQAREKLIGEMRRGVHVERSRQHGVVTTYMSRFGMPLVGWLKDLRR